jgi:hypothetical protein
LSTHTQFIISHSLLRDETRAGPYGLGCKCRAGSILVVDEAHNAAPASGSRYAIDYHFTKVMRDLCRNLSTGYSFP